MKIVSLLNYNGYALVDDEDYALVSKYHWSLFIVGRVEYCRAYMPETGKRVLMHRLILNPPDRSQVDHIDHDGLNNQRCNLRICTHSQNVRNGRKHRTRSGKVCTSTFKGVLWNGSSWIAQAHGTYLGSFDSEADAAKAYNDFARKHYGEFAMLNELDEDSRS